MTEPPAGAAALPYLDEEAVRAHLHWAELIAAMEQALIDYSAGRVVQPLRQVLPVVAHGGYLFSMPAATAEAAGVKLVTLYPGNAVRGIPTHAATIVLMRAEDGVPLAVMGGRRITEMRTAAVSAVATRRLAAPEARVLAILGSGVQARAHAEALRLVRPIDEIRVWSRNPAHAQRFAAEVGARATSAEDAVRGADIVVTATAATAPILEGAWLKPGAHVNAVGAPRPDWRELDDAVMANLLIVDSRAGAAAESGDVIGSGATIHAELGEVLAGKVQVPAGKTTVFKSLGMAVEDVAAALLVYQSAFG